MRTIHKYLPGYCRPLLAMCLLLFAAAAQADIEGRYESDNKAITIQRAEDAFTGEITLGDQVFPFTAQLKDGVLTGEFSSGDDKFAFSASVKGDELVFKTGQSSVLMQREKKAKNPFDQEAEKPDQAPPKNPFDKEQPKPAPKGIEGKWQDEWLYYEFKAGTLKLTNKQDASVTQTGSYSLTDGKLTMTFNDEQVVVGCKIEGDRMHVELPNGEKGELVRIGGADAEQAGAQEQGQPAGLNGRFSGQVEGVAAVTTLETKEGKLTGQINVDGYIYQLEAKANGNKATGQLTDSQNKAVLDCELILTEGKTLTITLLVKDPATGQAQRVPLTFSRQGAKQEEAGADDQGKVERDKAAVGVWRYTYTQVSGDFSIAVDTWMTLNADGTFRYGDSKAAAGGDAGTIDGGGAGEATVGTWMTKDKIIYAKEEGGHYEPFAKYYVEGDSMMFTFDDGSKQIWKRQ